MQVTFGNAERGQRYDASVSSTRVSDVGPGTQLESAELAPGLDPRLSDRDRRPLARKVIAGVLGLAAGAAFLASGTLLLLYLALTPYNARDAVLLVVLKSADVVGWLAIGTWLLVDWGHFRFRVLVPPVAAWMWVYMIPWASFGIGYLNWGP
jgi:hypothetical protein